jgi:acetyl esterase/lipase
MLLGLKLKPPPKVVVDVYGNVDLLAPHHWRHNHDVEWTNTEVSLETVGENLQQPNSSDAVLHAPFPWELANVPEKTTQHRWAAPDFTYSERVRRQTAIKDYLALSKLGIPYLVRVDHDAPLQQQQAVARQWSPLQLLDEQTTFPPTAIRDGTADQAVPLDMSRQLAYKLRQLGVQVLESYEDGGPHAFDQIYLVCNGWRMRVRC